MPTGKAKKIVKWSVIALLIVAAAAFMFEKRSGQTPAPAGISKVPVRAMKVIRKDTTITNEYIGQVQATNDIGIAARVSGSVVEKFASGGAVVTKGQKLFRIDSRQYESALLNAKAELTQAEAILANSVKDTQRYVKLYSADAIAEQQVTTQIATEKSDRAVVNAKRALVRQAQNDLDDTIVFAPMAGRLNVNDVSVGTYAVAGSTILVTMGSIDPMFVQFSMSEAEYLGAAKTQRESSGSSAWGKTMAFILSDGTEYPHKGTVSEIDRGLYNNSGTLAIKARVANPGSVLIPDMFVRVRTQGATIKNAILVPQRAVQQLLDKSFVMIVGKNDAAEARPCVLGEKAGSYWVVEKGLSGDETVVVEGLTKLQEGVSLDVKIATPEELELSFPDSTQGK